MGLVLLAGALWACGRLEIGSYDTLSSGGGSVPTEGGNFDGGGTTPTAQGGRALSSTGGADGATASGGEATSGGEASSSAGAMSGGNSASGGNAASGGEPSAGAEAAGGASGETAAGRAGGGALMTGGDTAGGAAGWAGAPSAGSAGGPHVNPSLPPSCRRTGPTCGGVDNSCCASNYVPSGSFNNFSDSELRGAVLSAFYLDQYEITVGRFSEFLASYDAWKQQGLHAGAGEHPLIPGSGWQEAWTRIIASNGSEMDLEVKNCTSIPADTMPGANAERAPRQCISWYEAFAFCIWDGGRLPTEAEWEYAAGGGAPSIYPWGNEPEPNPDLVVFNCGIELSQCVIPPVGSRPAGASPWGHLDMAGSMWEWAFDGIAIPPQSCRDCAHLDGSGGRVFRGGSVNSPDGASLSVSYRIARPPDLRLHDTGARCARDRR